MGLAVYLEDDKVITVENTCYACGTAHTDKIHKEYFHGKITHNLARMASSCGLYEPLWNPEENGIRTAEQMIPFLKEGIRNLEEDEAKHTLHEPDNGWGSYDNLLHLAYNYLEACKKFPHALVRVER